MKHLYAGYLQAKNSKETLTCPASIVATSLNEARGMGLAYAESHYSKETHWNHGCFLTEVPQDQLDELK